MLVLTCLLATGITMLPWGLVAYQITSSPSW
jgi:hypothetical protein